MYGHGITCIPVRHQCGGLVKNKWKGGDYMEKKKYVTPEVTSFTEAEILAELGKAHAQFQGPGDPPMYPMDGNSPVRP